jgi:diguanylate cyclase (GGDEF)-like protein/PAS domain S-box-containing protein
VDLYCAVPFFVAVIAPFMLRMFLGFAGFELAMLVALWFFFAIVFVSMRRIHSYISDNIVLRLDAIRRADILQKSELRFRQMFERPLTPMLLVDAVSHQIMDANPAASRFYQYPIDQLQQMKVSDIELNAESGDTKKNEAYRLSVHRQANGEFRPVEIYSSLLSVETRELQFSIIHDITERLHAQTTVHKLAFYDPLTDLPNRRMLQECLRDMLVRAKRSNNHSCLIFLDLDYFKNINDTQGHDVGDQLLIEVTRRLRMCIREADLLGRLGGDEFVVALEELSDDLDSASLQAETIAEKIRSVLSQPYHLGSMIRSQTNMVFQYYCSASIGVTFFNAEPISVNELLKRADLAMYQAKNSGRNAICFFDPLMQAALEEHARLSRELRHAQIQEQFSLYYQIQSDGLGHPVGAEVLLRWNHPERGILNPDEFIAHVEDSGLIVPLGLWVLRTACVQLKKWQAGPRSSELTLAVNVSAKQFHQADFVLQIQTLLLESGANPHRLKLELTESSVLDNVEDTIIKMGVLKKLGISFSMDDFGTGHSSLQYLKRLPLDQIKIDQSFVRDIATDPNDEAIVRAIIAMSHALGLNVVAEGVETEVQRDFLLEKGCNVFQGYLFGKPVPIEQFEIAMYF